MSVPSLPASGSLSAAFATTVNGPLRNMAERHFTPTGTNAPPCPSSPSRSMRASRAADTSGRGPKRSTWSSYDSRTLGVMLSAGPEAGA